MTATILTRWKLLLNLSAEERIALPSLFNEATGRTFIKDMGGRASIDFAPITLSCTTRFYDLLQSNLKHIGFSGRKFPLRHVQSGFDLHMRFRLHGSVMVVEIERSHLPLPEKNILGIILLRHQVEILTLAKAVLGLIKDPTPGFKSLPQLPKAFYCIYLVGDKHSFPSPKLLVEAITRHREPSEMMIRDVYDRNKSLQSDASTLLIDRQGVLMAIPSEIVDDETVIRRFRAACNMFEMVAAIERMAEQKSLAALPENQLDDLDTYFQRPDERFRFSTSSQFIWRQITSEFGMPPEKWSTARVIASKTTEEERNSMRKIMVVTALDTEAAQLIANLKAVTTVDLGEVYATRGMFEADDSLAEMYVCIAGVGNTQAAIETSAVWRLIRPDLTVFVGIAGGRKEATIGSVVIASRVYNYESGKEQANAFSPRPREVTPLRKPTSLVNAFLAALRSQSLRYAVYHKPIACGEKLIGSTQGATAQVVASTYDDALAVEMEGFGFLAALEASSAPAVLIRGISDRLDKKGEEEDHELAITNATDVAIRLVRFFLRTRAAAMSLGT